jgi:hypothetical protein
MAKAVGGWTVSDFDFRARKAADAVRRSQRSPGRVALRGAVAAAGLIIAGVVVGLPRGGGEAVAHAAALQPFTTCDAVLQYFKDNAPEYLIERAGGGVAAAAEGGGAPVRRAAGSDEDSSGATAG